MPQCYILCTLPIVFFFDAELSLTRTEQHKLTVFENRVLRQRLYNLTFTGPCIVIYSYSKSQWDTLFLSFILVKDSTCFGQTYSPSSGVLIPYSQQ